jgi:hypothetical protein
MDLREILTMEFRLTIRRLLRAPGFTVTTMLRLALGIGATIAMFAVVNGILINPLPFADSDRLVSPTHRRPERPNLPAIHWQQWHRGGHRRPRRFPMDTRD